MGGNNSTPTIPAGIHIVVVGGGYGGISLCLSLLKAGANFTLVDSRDAFHHVIASVRAVAVPGFSSKMFIDYKKTFGSHFRQGKMIGVDPGSNDILLEGGDRVHYDTLVIATGTSTPLPAKCGHLSKQEAVQQYEQYAQKVKTSKRIVVVGGGAVGVEVAGEIKTEYPTKDVTLIHSGSKLVMNNLKPSLHKDMEHALAKLKINLIKGEKVTNLDEIREGPGTIVTDKNTSIEADLVIRCIGVSTNKEAYTDGLGHAVNEKGGLRVKKTFQVDGYNNVYAIGDCAGIGDDNFAYLAMEHSKFILANIGKSTADEMIHYSGHASKYKISLTIGRNYGFGEMKNGKSMPGFLVKLFKGRDMMVGRFWKEMKQKPPK